MPDYLRPENHDLLRRRAGRVETHLASLSEYLISQPDDSMDRFVLLDAMDWMTPQGIHDLWVQIARVGRPGTRVIFRTAGLHSPIERALSILEAEAKSNRIESQLVEVFAERKIFRVVFPHHP